MNCKDEDELEEAMHGNDDDELEEAMHGKDEDDEVVDLSDMEGGEDDKGMGAMAGMDTAPEGELADVALTREEAEVFADFGMRVKKALDSEGEADAPDEDMAGVTDMDDEDEMGAEEKDAIVQEVLRRVTQRIVEAKLKGK